MKDFDANHFGERPMEVRVENRKDHIERGFKRPSMLEEGSPSNSNSVSKNCILSSRSSNLNKQK